MTTLAARAPGDARVQASQAPLILRTDFLYLFLVLFVAGGAIFRYGAINTYLWYALYAWTLARLCLEAPTLLQISIRNWPVFIWPALALASIVWSTAPTATLRGALQLLLTTIISIFIGSRFTLRQILITLTIAIFIASAASALLLLTGAPDIFADAGGFQGIFAHKNTLGLRMNLLIAGALILIFAARWLPLWLCALALGAYLLLLSKSATSQILALATPAILLGLAVLKLDFNKIAISAAAATAGFAALAAFLLAIGFDPVAFVLDSFDKDATLTGRTWIWERGLEEIAKHPILGGGYQAFWANEHSSKVLWIRHNTLESVKGFHNVWVEVWNDLGIAGILSLVAVLFCYARRVLRFHFRARTLDGLFPVFLLPVIIISASMNNSFFRQHELVHILLCAFFAATWLPSGTAKRGLYYEP